MSPLSPLFKVGFGSTESLCVGTLGWELEKFSGFSPKFIATGSHDPGQIISLSV